MVTRSGWRPPSDLTRRPAGAALVGRRQALGPRRPSTSLSSRLPSEKLAAWLSVNSCRRRATSPAASTRVRRVLAASAFGSVARWPIARRFWHYFMHGVSVPLPGTRRHSDRGGFFLHAGNRADPVSSGCLKTLNEDVFDYVRTLSGPKGSAGRVPLCVGTACPDWVQAVFPFAPVLSTVIQVLT